MLYQARIDRITSACEAYTDHRSEAYVRWPPRRRYRRSLSARSPRPGPSTEIEIPLDGTTIAWTTRVPYMSGPMRNRRTCATNRIFLKTLDIRASPGPDQIFVDALRYEDLEHGSYD